MIDPPIASERFAGSAAFNLFISAGRNERVADSTAVRSLDKPRWFLLNYVQSALFPAEAVVDDVRMLYLERARS